MVYWYSMTAHGRRLTTGITDSLLHERESGLVRSADDGLPVAPDSLTAWADRYHRFAVVGVRSDAVAQKIVLHLARFIAFFRDAYGHDRISACLRRDVVAWQTALVDGGMAPATVNNHLASLSAFTSWVASHAPGMFALGDPAKGISTLGLPPLEPRALSAAQVRSLKNVCDRLVRFHAKRGRRWAGQDATPHAKRRPSRDRALVFFLLSTGLRREEAVNVNLDQVSPSTPTAPPGERP